MNFKPILFNSDMVNAILENRKNQTRREIDIQIFNIPDKIKASVTDNGLMAHFKRCDGKPRESFCGEKNPYGEIGDVLWVRETTKVGAWDHEDCKIAFDYKASPELKKTPWYEYDDTEEFEKIQLKLIDKLDKLGVEPIIDEEKEEFHYKWES